MNKLKMVYIMLCLCISVSITSCAANTNMRTSSLSLLEVEAKELQAPVYGEQNLSVNKAASGANDFAFRLSAELAKNVSDESFVCSPYSVWLPLAALVNATNSQNREALLTALGATGISEEDINKAASRMLYDLTKERDKAFAKEYNEQYHNPLRIANAIFVSNNVTLRQESHP